MESTHCQTSISESAIHLVDTERQRSTSPRRGIEPGNLLPQLVDKEGAG
ncbi:MAG: hypothetical protein ACR2PC_06390 [Tsuneonella suprasediminis]